VFNLPVRGAGDGGAYSTAADMERLWTAMFAGRVVSKETIEMLVSTRSDAPVQRLRYGLGFWLSLDGATVILEGMDAGVSFRSAYHRPSANSYTVISNTSEGAWPIARHLDHRLAGLGRPPW
jgi:CubicO group peptidase (beta-lactamase class C family)